MLDLNSNELDQEVKERKRFFGDNVINNGRITGFVENVTLTEIAIVDNYCDFFFTDENGSKTNHREYAPDPSWDEEGNKKRVVSQMKRLRHIATRYLDDGSLPSANDLPAMWAALKTAITDSGKMGNPVRVKLVYNQKGFSNFPPYIPFIEEMTVALADTSLSLNEDSEQLTRPQPDSAESLGETEADKKDDDLPF